MKNVITFILFIISTVSFPIFSDNFLIEHQFYSVLYSDVHMIPLWVSYELTQSEIFGSSKRTNNFKHDPLIPFDASLSDYRGSGYDRGHMAPAADMAFSDEAMSESFFMTNICPQSPGLNRGEWKNLEIYIRKIVSSYGDCHIVTGPVISDDLSKIPETNVSIPEYFYKAILFFDTDKNTNVASAFIFPNKGTDVPFVNYLYSVDNCELFIGYDLFSFLPDQIENVIEISVNYEYWREIK